MIKRVELLVIFSVTVVHLDLLNKSIRHEELTNTMFEWDYGCTRKIFWTNGILPGLSMYDARRPSNGRPELKKSLRTRLVYDDNRLTAPSWTPRGQQKKTGWVEGWRVHKECNE